MSPPPRLTAGAKFAHRSGPFIYTPAPTPPERTLRATFLLAELGCVAAFFGLIVFSVCCIH